MLSLSKHEDEARTSMWDPGHPYRLRTWFRVHLPWWIINLGVANKADDCEKAGGMHRWYKIDDVLSGCYHCRVERHGQLWRDR
jgi:hypothetical protein